MTHVARPSLPLRRGTVKTMSGGSLLKILALLGVMSLTGLTLGCTKQIQAPTQTAPKHARHDPQEKPSQTLEQYPEHIAPPPAYGNKVVMAQSEPVTGTY